MFYIILKKRYIKSPKLYVHHSILKDLKINSSNISNKSRKTISVTNSNSVCFWISIKLKSKLTSSSKSKY